MLKQINLHIMQSVDKGVFDAIRVHVTEIIWSHYHNLTCILKKNIRL